MSKQKNSEKKAPEQNNDNSIPEQEQAPEQAAENELIESLKARIEVLEKLITIIAHFTGQEKHVIKAGYTPLNPNSIKRRPTTAPAPTPTEQAQETAENET